MTTACQHVCCYRSRASYLMQPLVTTSIFQPSLGNAPPRIRQRTGAMEEVNTTNKLEVLLSFLFSIAISVLFCRSHFYCQALRKHWSAQKAFKDTLNLGLASYLLGLDLFYFLNYVSIKANGKKKKGSFNSFFTNRLPSVFPFRRKEHAKKQN